MHYELWDTETRNLVEDFDGEDEALTAAEEFIALNPGLYPETLALGRHNDDGTFTWLAHGARLGERVAEHRTFARPAVAE